jgi:hypothetical protein
MNRLLGLAGASLLACVGTLEHEPEAYFGGVSVTDAGAAKTDGPARPAMVDDRKPPAPTPDAMPAWDPPDATAPWDAAPVAPDAMAQMPPPLMPDAAPPSACAPGPDALMLLSMKCGGCHNPMNPAKGLDLRTMGLAVRVVDVPSSCQGRPLVTMGPAGPSGHLLDKLEGPVPGCGNQMPFGGPVLTAQEKACLREWAGQAIAKVQNGKVMP